MLRPCLCPVGTRKRPPFIHKRGRDQRRRALRSVLFDMSGAGGEREARAYLCAPLYTPHLRTRPGAALKGGVCPLGTAHAPLLRSPLPLPVVPLPCTQAKQGESEVAGGHAARGRVQSLATSPTRRPILVLRWLMANPGLAESCSQLACSRM